MNVFVHLLNDRTGSPRVLRSVIDGLGGPGDILFVGSHGAGALDGVGIAVRRFWYVRTGNRYLTFATYLLSQVALFLALITRRLPQNATIYVNTLLPFGAALYGWMTGRRVIYHLHEVSLPSPLRWLLTTVARVTAARLIYVSEAHRALLPIRPQRSVVVANGVPPGAGHYRHRHDGQFVVLMLATPAGYKGVPEFVRLAAALAHRPDIAFRLVLSRPDRRWAAVENVELCPATDDPASHYANASLVVNLSRPDLWIETFGMTLLEAMSFGVPVIAPPVGGPSDLVEHGREGLLIDSRDEGGLRRAIERLADEPSLCAAMSSAASQTAKAYPLRRTIEGVRRLLDETTSERTHRFHRQFGVARPAIDSAPEAVRVLHFRE
ncbi:glycosyltransferase [Phenylobacterium sp.]|uniref:glycosyltransferase n=1 Tax=Phenylobacterium sp. TaxID=1871053 RepID=UPI0028116D46|nr:glycosyltransferase [Phenylobacterium sp.]